MPAISIKVGTKYACNNSFVEDHICLQSYHTIALKVFKKFQSLQAYMDHIIWSL